MTVAVQVSHEAEQQCGSTAVSDTPLSAASFNANRGVSQTAATRLFEYVKAAWNHRKGEHCTYKYTSHPHSGFFCASVTVRLPNRDPLSVTDTEYRATRTVAQNVVAQKALDSLAALPESSETRRFKSAPRRPNEKVQQFFDHHAPAPEVQEIQTSYFQEYPEYVMTPGPYPYYSEYPQYVYYDAYGYEQYAPQEYYYCQPPYGYGYSMQPMPPPFPPGNAPDQ